ncbi:MAG TPA: hypothetical protein VFD45_01195 [Patescibacteria group bacterium]|nr:hypothetical protein [Patescibacteria group bacterium]
MRNSEAIQLPIVCGIKPENLTDIVVVNVKEIWADVTGSKIQNHWIFHEARIKTELYYGRDGLAVTFGTKRGVMKLSVKKDGGLFVFNLDTMKEEKPINLHSFYAEIEQQFN